MTTSSGTWTEESVEAAGIKLQLIKGGTGEPLLILHGELGHPGWLRFHESLAQHHTLYIPSHPGFGKSERLDWIANMRDMAGWYLDALDDLAVGRVNAMGFSLGGWLAAEMATMCPTQFKKLVLVGAMGIKPPSGQIYDMFLEVAKEFIKTSYLDPAQTPEFSQICPEQPTPEQVEAWEVAREEACRLGWRPYMHYPSLPHLLRRLRKLPTLIVWGRQDAIVPVSAAEVYHASIPGSQLVILDNCGHHPEVEQSDEFVQRVQAFLA
ncbi:MAG TPA: alpha/beta hydrolase [Candidatus Tectomicrobia bacterium]|nr:alpha/beta hydrolase [Candidatus Tectomicrobia bacterium]